MTVNTQKNKTDAASEVITSEVINPDDLSPQSADEQKAQVQSAPTKSTRKQRIPIGTANLMNVPKRPGFKRRWVNDTEGRLSTFTAAGYEHVMTRDVNLTGLTKKAGADSQMGTPVSKQVGGGIKAFLMEQRDEWYKEDQAAKQKSIDELEKGTLKPDVDGQYGEVSVKNTR